MQRKPPILISPSLLAADFGCLEAEIKRAANAGADELHLDIMDARFVRNLSMGPNIVRMARSAGGLRLSVHLMMMHPEEYLDAFAEAGAGTLLVHIEIPGDHAAMLNRIRSLGIRAGITLNPETPAASVMHLLPLADEILVMSVHPGFGGQRFIDGVLPKMKQLRSAGQQRGLNLDISVDGGIDAGNARLSAAHGANLFIAGTSLFGAPDMNAAIHDLRAAAEKGRDVSS